MMSLMDFSILEDDCKLFNFSLDNRPSIVYNPLMVKKANSSERDFQNWFKKNWNGWHTQLHPGQSSDVGVPDLILGISQGLLPAEVKIGSIVDDVVWSTEIRPAQIVWHKKLADAGYNSILLIGVPSDASWRCFVVDAALARYWHETGWKLADVAHELDNRDLYQSLTEFVFSEMEN